MNRKVFSNYIYNLIYQILVIILPFITTPYISRILKPEGIGVFNYTYSVISVFILVASLGSHAYAQREIATVGDDKRERSITFWSILAIRIISSVIVSIVYLTLILLSDKWRTMYILEYLLVFANMLDISWFYQGMQDFKKTATRSIVIKLLSVISIFIFVNTERDLFVYTFICAFSTFLNACVLWIYARKAIQWITIDWNRVKGHVKPILLLFLPMAAIHVYTNVDKIILGLLSNESEVGYYSQSEKIVKLTMTIITAMGTVLLPQVASLISRSEMDAVKRQIKDAIHFVIALGFPMIIGLIIIASLFVPWFFGDGYESCIRLMQALAVLVLIIGLSSVTGQAVLIPLNKQNIYTISILIGMILNVTANLIFIPLLNSMGAVIGTILAETVVGLIQQVVVLKELGINFIEEILDNSRSILCGMVMAVVLFQIKGYFTSSTVSIILFMIIGVLIYALGMIVLKDRFLTQIARVMAEKYRK